MQNLWEEHGLDEDVTSLTEDNIIDPIDCYRHFITDEIIDLVVRETNRYAEQYFQTHETTSRSKFRQWKATTDQEMLKFLGIIIQMGLVQMPKLSHYWSSSKLYGSEIIRNSMSRERGSNCSSSFGIFRTTTTKIRTKTGCSS